MLPYYGILCTLGNFQPCVSKEAFFIMRNLFKSFLPFIFFFLIQLAVTVPMMVIQLTDHYILSHAYTDDTMTFFEYAMSMLKDTAFLQRLSVVFAVTVIIIFGIWYRKRFIAPFRKRQKKYWSGFSMQILFALIFLGFGLQYITSLFSYIVSWIEPSLLYNYNSSTDSAGYNSITLMLAVYTVILSPIGEELVFRGLTYRFARKALPFWGANILQAVLFGIMHLNLFQGLYAFILGLFLGWICHTGRGIRYTILLHMIFNLLGTIFSGFFQITMSLSLAGFSLIGIALTIFALYIYKSEFRLKNAQFRSRLERKKQDYTAVS